MLMMIQMTKRLLAQMLKGVGFCFLIFVFYNKKDKFLNEMSLSLYPLNDYLNFDNTCNYNQLFTGWQDISFTRKKITFLFLRLFRVPSPKLLLLSGGGYVYCVCVYVYNLFRKLDCGFHLFSILVLFIYLNLDIYPPPG